jgi:hypothetical protein
VGVIKLEEIVSSEYFFQWINATDDVTGTASQRY